MQLTDLMEARTSLVELVEFSRIVFQELGHVSPYHVLDLYEKFQNSSYNRPEFDLSNCVCDFLENFGS